MGILLIREKVTPEQMREMLQEHQAELCWSPTMRWQEKKVKFQKDPPSRRLGNLAVNLNRVGVFAEKNTPESVFNLLSESIRFIEWTAPEVNPEVAEQLVRYQVQLSRWCFGWNRIWSNATKKENLVLQTKSMSDFILGVM